MKNIKTSSDDFIKIFISKEQSLILNKISPKMWTRLRIDQPSALRAKDMAQNNRGLFLKKTSFNRKKCGRNCNFIQYDLQL